MTSYRSELDGIAAGLSVLGTLSRSGSILIRSVTLIYNNSAAVLPSKRDLAPGVFHHMESDDDLITTIKYLEREWCRYIDVRYSWVKGHLDRPQTRNERSNNVEVDTLADQIRLEARGPRRARPECNHWELDCTSLLIEGVKCTGQMKQKLR
jgi:hypothetical protein